MCLEGLCFKINQTFLLEDISTGSQHLMIIEIDTLRFVDCFKITPNSEWSYFFRGYIPTFNIVQIHGDFTGSASLISD